MAGAHLWCIKSDCSWVFCFYLLSTKCITKSVKQNCCCCCCCCWQLVLCWTWSKMTPSFQSRSSFGFFLEDDCGERGGAQTDPPQAVINWNLTRMCVPQVVKHKVTDCSNLCSFYSWISTLQTCRVRVTGPHWSINCLIVLSCALTKG